MIEKIEISSFDLRYESYRLKAPSAEKVLLTSILENGIRDPLQGVDTKDKRLLLNGFKRYRCAQKLGIGIVPYRSLGNDEACGILELIRNSNSKSLSILEQARLIDELNHIHNMSNSDIALLLEKSKAWVSVRLGMIRAMSNLVRTKIFAGEFPVYAYMYTLRQFMRINSIKKEDVDQFVRSVAGKGLSLREIELLAHGFFKGGNEIRDQIIKGNISWGLSRLKEPSGQSTDCTYIEQAMLRDLEITQKYMRRVINKSKDERFKTSSFLAQANLLAGGILRQMDRFTHSVKELYDKSEQTQGHLLPLSGRNADSRDCPSPQC